MNQFSIRLGIGINSTFSPQELLRYAKEAERVGIDEFWLAEGYHNHTSTAAAAVIGSSTNKIRLGLGVLSPYTRHPLLTAMEVATLDEISHGRMTLAFGAVTSAIIKHGSTVRSAKPAVSLRECVKIVRAALAGELVIHDNPPYKIPAPGIKLTFQPVQQRLPIYMGVSSPLGLQAAGQLADGILLNTMSSIPFVRYAMEHVRVGAKRAGRSVEDLDLGAYLVVSVSDDRRAASEAVKETLAWYLVRVGTRITRSAGVSDSLVDEIRASTARYGLTAETTGLIDDETIGKLAIVGDSEDVANRLEEYVKAGLKVPIAYQVWGPDREVAIRTLGKSVKPLLRKKLRR